MSNSKVVPLHDVEFGDTEPEKSEKKVTIVNEEDSEYLGKGPNQHIVRQK